MVEWNSLENCRVARPPGFESLPLRQSSFNRFSLKMNLILFDSSEVSPFAIPLSDPRYHHIKNILKARLGDELTIGQINGRMGKGRIAAIHEENVTVEAVNLDQEPPKPLAITLILALPRPPMLQRTLAAVASLGIKRIYLIQTNRVEKSYWNSHVLKPEEIRKTLILGLQQAKDTVLPEVHLKKRFKPFVQDELPGIAEGFLKLAAHPEAGAKSCPVDVKQPVILMIGPEGGFVPYEIELLKQAGFQTVHLGERILRFETAVEGLLCRIANIS